MSGLSVIEAIQRLQSNPASYLTPEERLKGLKGLKGPGLN